MSDPLDPILRADAAVPIRDAGFSSRVLAAIPARRADSRLWLRPALVLGSMALGAMLAIVLSPAAGSLLEGFSELAQLRMLSPAAVSVVAITCALLVSAVIIAVDTD